MTVNVGDLVTFWEHNHKLRITGTVTAVSGNMLSVASKGTTYYVPAVTVTDHTPGSQVIVSPPFTLPTRPTLSVPPTLTVPDDIGAIATTIVSNSQATTSPQLITATNTMVGITPASGQNWIVLRILAWSGAYSPPAGGGNKLGDRQGNVGLSGEFTESLIASTPFTGGTGNTLTCSGLAYLTGVRIDFAAALASSAIIQIQNLTGGTQQYQLATGTTFFDRQFLTPIAAPYAAPAIVVPVISSGPAYTINAYGIVMGAGYINEEINIFKGLLPATPSATASNAHPTDAIVLGGGAPFVGLYQPEELIVQSGQSLYADFWNAIGTPCNLAAEVLIS